MLPSGKKFEVREKKSYPPLPEDIYQVELLDIEMESVPDKNNPGRMNDVLKFQFVVLDDATFQAEGQVQKTRGRSIFRNFVPTYIWEKNNEKNALYQITKAIIMREMKPEEMANFSSDFINKLIGYQCRVTTLNVAGKGKNADQVYTNIDKFLPKKDVMPKLTAEEKEKATMKKKDDNDTSESAMPAVPVKDEEIPVVGETAVEAAVRELGGKVVEEGEKPLDISEVPF